MRTRSASIGELPSVVRILVLTAAATAALALGSAEAQAVIEEPIPADVGPTPPPIPTLHPAGETPPAADAIGDPITPEATCGGWHQQSKYGDRWPTDASWWEFRCSFQDPHCTGICNANTSPDLWVDHFYWDGSQPVFYGEFFGAYYWSSYVGVDEVFEYWWDEPAGGWYRLPPPPSEPEPANATPTASFTAACSGSSCSFDAGASNDSDGSIDSYYWDFGDHHSAGGASIDHAYAEAGTYTVTLTVRDNRGAQASDSESVTVEAPPPSPPNDSPTASFTFTCSALTCDFDGTRSTDGDGAIVAYQWDFGDHSVESGSSATVEHTYREAGTYDVRLTVVDDGQARATSDAKAVTATNAAPTANFTFTCSKLSCSFDGSGSADGDGTINSYWWDFGDASPLGVGSMAEHTYANGGSYTVKLTVIDNGGLNATASRAVTVEASGGGTTPNATPTARFTVGCSALSCSFDASESADSDGTIESYSWDFGDGASGSGKSAQHTYAGPGSYTVKLTVTDDGGATATDAKPVTATVIALTARAYKVKGLQKVDLSWSGSGAASFDVYREGTTIATVQTSPYTDNIDRKGSGTYRYKVCEAGTSTCSDQTTVSF
jgi:PKD repeat protein